MFIFNICLSAYINSVDFTDDGKLVAESDSGEFWVLFGGFAPIGKKATSEDDVTLETTPGKLYRYLIHLRLYKRRKPFSLRSFPFLF